MRTQRLYSRCPLALVPCVVLGVVLLALPAGAQPMIEQGQNETIFRAVAGGPLPNVVDVPVGLGSGWTVEVDPSGPPMLGRPTPAEGTGPGAVKLGLSNWAAGAAPGRYEKTVRIVPNDGSAAQQWKMTLEIVPRLPGPEFTYIDGPHGCEPAQGLPDEAVCKPPDERPPGGFTPPGPGGAYIDPNFGAQVRILSGPRSTHGYSSPSAISANNKHALLFQDAVNVVELDTGRVVRRRIGTPFEGAMWDARDENILYFFSGASIRSYDVARDRIRTVVDYSGGPYRFGRITGGGTADTSKDNWIPFVESSKGQACAYSVDDDRTFCGDYSAVPRGPHRVDFAQIAKGVDSQSGKRYFLLVSTPVMMVFSVNEGAGTLEFENYGPETAIGRGDRDGVCEPGDQCIGSLHLDTFEDSNGLQHFITSVESFAVCGFSLYSFQLNRGPAIGAPVELGGGAKKMLQMYRCGGMDRWNDMHIGCAKASPHCVVATTNAGFNRQLGPNESPQRTAHVSEIFVIRDNGAEIRRLAQHRSVPLQGEPANSYWSTPRACMSPDGAWVLADSNFGQVEQIRVILVETGFGPPKLAAEGVVNAASLERKIAAGSIATLFGQNLANCRSAADSFPLPDRLCGASVEFAGRLGAMLYAGPSQLNVIVPPEFSAGGELKVKALRDGRETDLAAVFVPQDFAGPLAPAIYTYSLGEGVQRAVIQNGNDLSLNGPLGAAATIRPLEPGEFGSLFANGLGPTDPPTSIRDPAPAAEPLARAVSNVEVYVNDRRQELLYAGLAPGFSSVFQVNFRFDPATPIRPAGSNEVWLRIDGQESPRLVLSLAGEPAPPQS